jgi:hypothetical protein
MMGGYDRSTFGGLLWGGGGGAMMRGWDWEAAGLDKEVTPEVAFTETKSGLNDPGRFQR